MTAKVRTESMEAPEELLRNGFHSTVLTMPDGSRRTLCRLGTLGVLIHVGYNDDAAADVRAQLRHVEDGDDGTLQFSNPLNNADLLNLHLALPSLVKWTRVGKKPKAKNASRAIRV